MNDDQASSEFMKLNKIIIQLFKKKKSIRKKNTRVNPHMSDKKKMYTGENWQNGCKLHDIENIRKIKFC